MYCTRVLAISCGIYVLYSSTLLESFSKVSRWGINEPEIVVNACIVTEKYERNKYVYDYLLRFLAPERQQFKMTYTQDTRPAFIYDSNHDFIIQLTNLLLMIKMGSTKISLSIEKLRLSRSTRCSHHNKIKRPLTSGQAKWLR